MGEALEAVLEALRQAGSAPRRSGAGWSARCPAHDDRDPSLAVAEGEGGKALVHCHAGCEARDVVAALGLSWRALFAPADPMARHRGLASLPPLPALRLGSGGGKARAGRRVEEERYTYLDGDGRPDTLVIRYGLFDEATGERVGKTFRQMTWDGQGWRWGLNGHVPPLFRLPEVRRAASAPPRFVVVVEGEKDALTLAERGVPVTTNAMGAGSWRDEHTAALAGANVLIIADDDGAGIAHARDVAARLRAAGVSVAAMAPTRGKDITEHLAAGGDLSQLRRLDFPDPPALEAAPESEAPPVPAPARGGWSEIDLEPWMEGRMPEDGPTMLKRADGQALIYPGRVNMLVGEPESGKSWLALAAVAQELAAGRSVALFDFEDSPGSIVARLRALGVAEDALSRLAYACPDGPLTPEAAADVADMLERRAPTLAVVDGINAAMALCGLDLNSNKDATAFSQALLRRLCERGAGVLGVDHVTKSREGRGQWAIGAQAKRADVDGCILGVEAVVPFGRGQRGLLRLTVLKDRPGHVRAASANSKNAGEAHIASDGASVDLEIHVPDMRPAAERGPFRPTALMQKVSEFLERIPEGATKNAIEGEVTGKREFIRKALEVLHVEGYLEVSAGARSALVHRSVRPYRESADPSVSAWPPPDVLGGDFGQEEGES